MEFWQQIEWSARAHLANHINEQVWLTGGSADSAVDLRSNAPGRMDVETVARINSKGTVTVATDIQRLIASAGSSQAAFYSLAAYSKQAIKLANDSGVTLFAFNSDRWNLVSRDHLQVSAENSEQEFVDLFWSVHNGYASRQYCDTIFVFASGSERRCTNLAKHRVTLTEDDPSDKPAIHLCNNHAKALTKKQVIDLLVERNNLPNL